MRVVELIISGLYSGYSPVSPGTAGTAALTVIWLAFALSFGALGIAAHLMLALACSALGVYLVSRYLAARYGEEERRAIDPQFIVIDEWAGMLIALTGVAPTNLVHVVLAFALFRVFDIMKPGPVSMAERLPGAWGIMLDDIVAGVFAALLLQLGIWSFPTGAEAQKRLEPNLPAVAALSASEAAALPQGFLEALEIDVPTHKGTEGVIAVTLVHSGRRSILELNMTTKELTPLVHGAGNNSYPVWSPDGTKLAFVSDRDGNNEVYVSDKDGGNLVRMTNNSVDDGDPAWSSDGKYLAFYSETNKKGSNIFTMPLSAPGKASQVTRFTGYNSTPAWSPDGRNLLFSTSRIYPSWSICSFELATRFESCLLQGHQSYCRPRFGHKGNKFVFSYGFQREISLEIMDLDKRQRKPLTKLKGSSYDPNWSPDDRYIVFANDAEKLNDFALNANDQLSGDMHTLLKAPGFSFRHPSWRQALPDDPGAAPPSQPDSPAQVDGAIPIDPGAAAEPAAAEEVPAEDLAPVEPAPAEEIPAEPVPAEEAPPDEAAPVEEVPFEAAPPVEEAAPVEAEAAGDAVEQAQ